MTKPPIPLRPQHDASLASSVIRAAFASHAACERPGITAVEEVARRYPTDEPARLLLTRAAVSPSTTTDTGWAAALADRALGEFLTSLAPMSAAARLIDLGTLIPLAPGALEMRIPQRTSGAVARPWTTEGAPINVTLDDVGTVTTVPGTLGIIAVATGELSRRSGGATLFRDMLVEDAAASLDAAYFGADAATASNPPGLLYGLTVTANTGDAMGDLGALAAAVGAGGSGQVVYVMGPGRAASAALRRDLNATILASGAVPEDRVIAVDPRALVHGVNPFPDIRSSQEAILHMEDANPLEIVSGAGPATAAPVASMFQTDMIATRLLIGCAFVKRRAGAVAFMDTVYGW